MNAAKDTSSRSHAVFIIVPLGGAAADSTGVLMEQLLWEVHMSCFPPLYIQYMYCPFIHM